MMWALPGTLKGISPRCCRAWCVLGGDEALLATLRKADFLLTEIGEADACLLLGGVPFPAGFPGFVFAFGEVPMAAGSRLWLEWPLDADGRLSTVPAAHLLRLVLPPGYDLAEHMHRLVLAGKAVDALELVRNFRDDLFAGDDERGRVATGEMLALFALDRALGENDRLNRFATALEAFHRATTLLPRAPMAYEVLGAFWQRIGRPDMRVRVSNSICHAYGGDCQPVPAPPVCVEQAVPVATRASRVLMILHNDSDFGTDTLYDGLCEILGDDNVVEYPWKPTLHGKQPENTMGYPCLFQRGGEALPLEAVSAQLEAGYFDAVLFSDTLGNLPTAEVARLAAAGRGVPWYVLDMWDQPGDYRAEIVARLPGIAVRGWFKREKIVSCDYGDAVHALPFAFAEQFAISPAWEGRDGVFWAGKPVCGGRRLVLEYLSKRFSLELGATFAQAQYKQRLSSSLIGLCLFGNGFDTVRYWEIPAHGVMLLAERPPIEIPNNFVDGESAVFFDDLGDLEEKLTHYLAHPGEALRIARAGHFHYRQHHTATARAQRLLSLM